MVTKKPSSPPIPPAGPRRRSSSSTGFSASLLLVLGTMLAAGLAQHLYLHHLLPNGTLQKGWFQALAAGWVAVLLAGVGLYGRWLFRLLSSVRTSVTILVLFTLSCIAGSFVLQQRDLDTRGLKGEKAYAAFRLAQAGFVYTMVHGRDVEVPMRPQAKDYFATLRSRFGDEFADERQTMFHRMMGGRTVDQDVQRFAEEHDAWFRSFWEFCNLTRLGDMHRSWWFVALMAMLACSLAAGTYKRWVWRREQIGFLTTHAGFLVLMVGFALSMWGEERGMLPLTVGDTLDQIYEFNSKRRMRLPFRVTLADFYTEFHHELVVEFLDVDHQAREFPGPITRGLKADEGRTYDLFEGKYRIEVVRAAEYGSASSEVVNVPGGKQNPAIAIDVSSPDGLGANGWLFAGSGAQSFYQDPEGKFVVSFHWGDDPHVQTAPEPGEWGHLVLHVDGLEPRTVPVRVGEVLEYDGKRIEVARIAPDFARRDDPIDSQQVRNPAVLLKISTPEDPEPKLRWNFAWLDFDSMHTPAFPELRLKYRFRAGNQDPTRIYRIHGSQEGLELVRFDAGGEAYRQPVAAEAPIPMGSESLQLRVQQVYPTAEIQYPVTPVFERALLETERHGGGTPDPHAGHDHGPGQHDDHAGHDHGPGEHGDHAGHDHGPGEHGATAPDHEKLLGPLSPSLSRKFHPPGPPAVKLRITHPGGTTERWFLSGHPVAGSWTDGTLGLRFHPNQNKVKEWRSLLVVSDGTETQRQMVRVNHPLVFRGWTMYQTDAKLDDPTYSGIQVLYDPGWYFIEPGLILVCFGVIFMFWIKPWLKQDQSGGSRAARKGAK